MIDEDERLEAAFTDAQYQLLFAEDSRATMLPRDEVELLARASPFEEWHVTGRFSDEPLADGHTKQVWTLEKTG